MLYFYLFSLFNKYISLYLYIPVVPLFHFSVFCQWGVVIKVFWPYTFYKYIYTHNFPSIARHFCYWIFFLKKQIVPGTINQIVQIMSESLYIGLITMCKIYNYYFSSDYYFISSFFSKDLVYFVIIETGI